MNVIKYHQHQPDRSPNKYSLLMKVKAEEHDSFLNIFRKK